MNKDNLTAVIREYEEQFERIDNKADHTLHKWQAIRCFQDVWFSDDNGEDPSFDERFQAATKECAALLDRGQSTPIAGVLKLAEQEPEAVERLFVEVLFADDRGDLKVRQEHVEDFLDGMEALRRRSFAGYPRYSQDRHSATSYLCLFAPEDNYVYRYSEAEEFAGYIEYGVDIGRGQRFRLDAYYGLCDLVVDELREHPGLLEKYRKWCAPSGYYDDSLHVLAYDVIFCAHGCHLIDAQIAATGEEQRESDRIFALETQIRAMEMELDGYRGLSLLDAKVAHRQYGAGVVGAQNGNIVKVRFNDGVEKSFVIHEKYPARPIFENDERVVAAFTAFDRLTKEIGRLRRQLEAERAKAGTR